jgi:hypothetical protein
MGGFGGSGTDWMHVNGIGYSIEKDLIVFSSNFFSEIYVIDHSTTTEEARGHTGGNHGKGGDILLRWGNPSNWGGTGEQFFNPVHSAHWIPMDCSGGGNILALNNNKSGQSSILTELVPPYNEAGSFNSMAGSPQTPEEPLWTYSGDFFTRGQGSVQRLPNGNTFLNESGGDMYEVTADGEVVWEYSPQRGSTRAQKYAVDYPGILRLFGTPVENSNQMLQAIKPESVIRNRCLDLTLPAEATVRLVALNGKTVFKRIVPAGRTEYSLSQLPYGIYLLQIKSSEWKLRQRVSILK